MITIDDVVINLIDELENHIKSNRDPYKSDVAEVREGVHGHKDIINKPFLGVHIIVDDVDTNTLETTGTDAIRRGMIKIYCYMVGTSLNDYSNINQMYKDLRYFLKYDFSYRDYTWVKGYTPLKNGINVPVDYFELDIEVLYQEEI